MGDLRHLLLYIVVPGIQALLPRAHEPDDPGTDFSTGNVLLKTLERLVDLLFTDKLLT